MGSCISHENQPDGKAELATNLEDQSTKIEAAQMRKIAAMSASEKVSYVQSSELADYLRLCYLNKKSMWQEVLHQAIPNDTKTLISSIKTIQAKIKNLNASAPGASNPNHTQFISVVHYYSMSFESSLNEYLKAPNTLIPTLQQTFTVLIKTLQVLYCLTDGQLQAEERWWGTGNNHTQLHGELDQCKLLFEEPLKQFATEYLSGLYGSLNLHSEQQNGFVGRENSDNLGNKGGIISNADNGSQNSNAAAAASAGQALNVYLPSLYKTTLEQVMARQ